MKLKTFIKWSGNKSKHLKHILPFIPSSYKTYIEPFVGSGALFLNLQPKKSIINDLNKDLINCWESVKNNPLDILKIFDTFGKIFKPLDNKDKVVLCREITASIEMSNYDYNRAAIFMLMKFCGYNGHIFVNNKFLFGSLDMNIYINDRFFFLEEPMSRNIFEVSKYLNNTDCSIYNKDYKTILSKAKKGDFVFMDPPYVESHNYQFNYNKDEKLDINYSTLKINHEKVCE